MGEVKKRSRLPFIGGAVIVGLCAPFQAHAAISFGGWSWSFSPLRHERHLPPVKISVLPIKTNNAIGGILKADIILKNSGKEREGLLLRYVLSAQIDSPLSPKKEKGWTIPFAVDERRVPRIQSGQNLEVPFDISGVVKDYFKRLVLEGWRPEKIKMTVMIEPQQGRDSALTKASSVLPIQISNQ